VNRAQQAWPGNLFEKQFDVCVFKSFPKQTFYFTNSFKYLDWALECRRNCCRNL